VSLVVGSGKLDWSRGISASLSMSLLGKYFAGRITNNYCHLIFDDVQCMRGCKRM
jgi:hypothetical protein